MFQITVKSSLLKVDCSNTAKMLKEASNNSSNVQAVKTVRQSYVPTQEINQLLTDFRKMANEAIRIALSENLTARFPITTRCYPIFATYPYPTFYRLAAINIATGLLHNYRREVKKNKNAKKPYLTHPLLRIWASAFEVKDGVLRLSLKPNRGISQNKKTFVYLPLTPYVLRSIQGFTVRSVTLTACTMSLAFSKETVVTVPTGLIGIDRNLDNVTTATLDGKTKLYDLSKATETKMRYREVKSHFRRNDARIIRKISRKYGCKQRNKVQDILHRTSKQIIEQAKATNSGIVMENLKGIRKLYRKGNGQGTHYRSRLNGWSYFELQRQIEYKAKWHGIPVIYVRAAKTSSICSICGCEITECSERKVWCGRCQRSFDRDENAALNIVKRGVILAPGGSVVEAMKGNEITIQDESTPILIVDTDK
jgi:putative transposase